MWEVLGALASGIGSILGSNAQSDAANAAAQAQLAANKQQQSFLGQNFNTALGAQQNQFGQGMNFLQGQQTAGNALAQNQLGNVNTLLNPYNQAGQQALSGMSQLGQAGLGGYQQALQGQQNLLGLGGADAQAQAIAGIQNSPQMAALTKVGENAILQNASATGGLRGGNVQGALAQFQPQMLSQLINQQYANLGSMGSLGMQGASALGSLGQLGQGAAQSQATGGLGVLQGQLGLANQAMTSGTGMNNQLMNNLGTLYGNYGTNMSGLMGNVGSINAANDLAQGQAQANMYNGLASSFDLFGQRSDANANFQSLLNKWGGLGSTSTSLGSSLPNNPFSLR
jgi:hypothetical protein